MIITNKANQEENHKSAVKVESLDWHQDCLCVTVLVASSFGEKGMRRLLKRAGYVREASLEGRELLLASLHEGCHHDPDIRGLVAKELAAKYKATVARCKGLDPAGLLAAALDRSCIIPFIWACFQRDNPNSHKVGRQLAHLAVAQGMERIKLSEAVETNVGRLEKLVKKNQDFSNELDALKRENRQLQARLRSMKNQPVPENLQTASLVTSLRKEVRTLRSELMDQKQRQTKQRNQLAVWRSLALSKVGCEAAVPGPAQPKDGGWCSSCQSVDEVRQKILSEECKYKRCLLGGRKIGVVGGLKRLEQGYCDVVERLGGECLFHSGETKSGVQSLRQLVDKSDMVVCITSINSHGAMHIVKKQCKRCQKQFCPMKGTGVNALENLLLEMAS